MRLSKKARALLEELAKCSSCITHRNRETYCKLVNAGLAEEQYHCDHFGPRVWSYRITDTGRAALTPSASNPGKGR